MYKILLVDDKIDSIKAISKLVDWEKEGIDRVILATNGKEALEKVYEDIPDIIITDIKMPIMDGLQLTEEIKKINNESIVIILSGYDEFSFAQKALKLGVSEYLLKPVSIEDIESVVRKAVKALKNREDSREKKDDIEDQIKKTAYSRKVEYLNRLIKTPAINVSLLNKKYKDITLNIKNENILSIMVYIDDYNDIKNQKTLEELDMMLFAMESMFLNALENYYNEIFKIKENKFCIIVNKPQDLSIKSFLKEIESVLTRAQTLIEQILSITVTIGIGKWVKELSKINLSYEDARQAIKYRVIRGKNSLISAYEINNLYLDHEKNYFKKVEEITELYRKGKYQELIRDIDSFWKESKEADNIGPMAFKSVMIQILISVSGIMQDYCIENAVFENKVNEVMSLIDSYSSSDAIKEKIKQCFRYGIDLINSNQSYISRLDVDKAIAYLKSNYKTNISLKEVAGHINLSPSYLSMLIKEYTNENFKEMLVRYRMEEAKRLLSVNHYKIYEVADMVGYNDHRHFSEAFKKYTGLKPTEYKRKYI